ncbi:hypothetical protein GCM10027445_20480 [Amycolatopsis endophytica]|uniref:Uncharacterized protein n=1 Tax=Amycolatopsis endophytica TaxID=860233 RepID=A0A853BEP7_9PSEU|nr:hypothetical protein [Amycolatopsis endophytica]NYI93057.1 hypothetical protein [Amycolatopsis endophytica]
MPPPRRPRPKDEGARKRARELAGLVSAGVLTATALPNAPEAAAIDHEVKTTDGDPGGVAWFTEHGDHAYVCDIEADGWAAGLWVYWNGGSYTLSAGGSGNCALADASEAGHDLPENAYLNFRLYLHKSGTAYAYQRTAQWYNDN